MEKKMRTLYEIMELAKDGGRPEYDELYYALVAVDNLSLMDRNRLYMDFLKDPPPNMVYRKMIADGIHGRWKSALSKSPKLWLGDSYDPRSKEYQEQRAVHRKIAEKFFGEQ
jgi:hypothetical protein